MWHYSQSTGDLFQNGIWVARGYSGHPTFRNRGMYQDKRALGPIPRGAWLIVDRYNSQRVGPYALVLKPMEGTETFGRSGFRIHGDSISAPGTASKGCIIMPRTARIRLWQSGDRTLLVGL